MYSELIGLNFSNPTHNGVVDHPDVTLENFDPVCGDQVRVTLRLDDKGKISAARFEGWGCATSIAASNIFCHWLEKKSLAQVVSATTEELACLLGELAPEQRHCIEILVRLVEQVKAWQKLH